MKHNIIGIIGGIIALVSLFLPWWTIAVSMTEFGFNFSVNVSVYLYQATESSTGTSTLAVNIWYGWVALVLVVICGLLGIAGGALRKTRLVFAAGGILALLAIIIFAAGLQDDISGLKLVQETPTVGLFIALAAAIVMLAASFIKPETDRPVAPSPTPTTPPSNNP